MKNQENDAYPVDQVILEPWKILKDLTHILSYANLTKILDKSCEIVIRYGQDLVWILYNVEG